MSVLCGLLLGGGGGGGGGDSTANVRNLGTCVRKQHLRNYIHQNQPITAFGWCSIHFDTKKCFNTGHSVLTLAKAGVPM